MIEKIDYSKLKDGPNFSKEFYIEKTDIEIKYGYLIFDVENEKQNKTLHAIAMSYDLGEDYHNSCNWIVSNTKYYPGTMNLYLKMFIIIKRLGLCLVIPHNDDYTILFEYTEEKEDGVLLCKSLLFKNDETQSKNVYLALQYYYNIEELLEDFKKKQKEVFDKLTENSKM